jgi:hypothetical protein
MRGHGHAYHQQMGHGNAPMPHMPPQMGVPGVQGMQGMQPFTGMMMPGMGMGMPGMPDMPHMMTNMMGLFPPPRVLQWCCSLALGHASRVLIVVLHARVRILLQVRG